jgi:hypothetical protein
MRLRGTWFALLIRGIQPGDSKLNHTGNAAVVVIGGDGSYLACGNLRACAEREFKTK